MTSKRTAVALLAGLALAIPVTVTALGGAAPDGPSDGAAAAAPRATTGTGSAPAPSPPTATPTDPQVRPSARATVPSPTGAPASAQTVSPEAVPTGDLTTASPTPSTSSSVSPGVSAEPGPAPVPSSYPGPSTTGSHGVRGVRPGGTVTRDGAVISNVVVNGQLTVEADDVVIRNVMIRTSSSYGVLTYGLRTVVEDTTVIGTPGATLAGIAAYPPGSVHVRRVDVSRVEDGVRLAHDSSLVDSYVHDLAGGADSHYDGVTADGYRGWTIRHNTILNPHDQTAAVWIGDPRYEASEGLLAENLLAGGGYTVYAGTGTGTGLHVVDNVFSTRYHPQAGHWGPITEWSGEGNTWHGNVWLDGPSAGRSVNR